MNRPAAAIILSALIALILPACAAGKKDAGAKHILTDISQTAPGTDDFWTFAAPRSQKINPAKLKAALAAVDLGNYEIHSMTIVKNGKIVMDCYGTDRQRNIKLGPNDRHELHSVTKSITSVLLDIAIEEGKISGVTEKALPWFSADGIKNITREKKDMTLENLLTMRSGLEWNEGPDDPLFFDPPNSAKAILDRPLVGKPGTVWHYSSGNSQILGEIVRRATGKTPRQYADEKLFGPLGITDYQWMADRSGTNYGGWGLFMRPRDLARFGYLCLKGGAWKGTQPVPAALLRDSTSKHSASPWDGGDYGYHWWVPFIGGFAARGYLGQVLYVFPEKDLVVVFTSNLDNDRATSILDGLMTAYILPACAQ